MKSILIIFHSRVSCLIPFLAVDCENVCLYHILPLYHLGRAKPDKKKLARKETQKEKCLEVTIQRIFIRFRESRRSFLLRLLKPRPKEARLSVDRGIWINMMDDRMWYKVFFTTDFMYVRGYVGTWIAVSLFAFIPSRIFLSCLHSFYHYFWHIIWWYRGKKSDGFFEYREKIAALDEYQWLAGGWFDKRSGSDLKLAV